MNWEIVHVQVHSTCTHWVRKKQVLLPLISLCSGLTCPIFTAIKTSTGRWLVWTVQQMYVTCYFNIRMSPFLLNCTFLVRNSFQVIFKCVVNLTDSEKMRTNYQLLHHTFRPCFALDRTHKGKPWFLLVQPSKNEYWNSVPKCGYH